MGFAFRLRFGIVLSWSRVISKEPFRSAAFSNGPATVIWPSVTASKSGIFGLN